MTAELFTEAQVTRQPLRYHGAKFRVAGWIIGFMPEHRAFVEVFGGAAGVLLRKPKARVEVYNDLDGQVVNFWRVLRDPEKCQQLARLVDFTPFSRQEFEDSYEPCADPVEAARRFVVRCFFGFGTAGSCDVNDSNGFRSCDLRRSSTYNRDWNGAPEAIVRAGTRFKDATIENLDFRKLIPKFDSEETFFYVDPPYLMETRKAGGKGYVHELTKRDHEQLAWILKGVKGKVAISGYPSSLYDGLYSDWHRESKEVAAAGQRGAVSRTEVLWMNYTPPTTDSAGCTAPAVP
jgi:DNA adenine methylase